MAAGEESASGSAESKKKAVCWKYFQTAKVLIMERPSVELAVIFVVRSLLTMGPLLYHERTFETQASRRDRSGRYKTWTLDSGLDYGLLAQLVGKELRYTCFREK